MNRAGVHYILVAAREKIADPNNWGQGARPGRINPRSCCASEAIEECAWYPDRLDAYDALSAAIGTTRIVAWNDAPGRTHGEVLAAFTTAIASLGGRSPEVAVTNATDAAETLVADIAQTALVDHAYRDREIASVIRDGNHISIIMADAGRTQVSVSPVSAAEPAQPTMTSTDMVYAIWLGALIMVAAMVVAVFLT